MLKIHYARLAFAIVFLSTPSRVPLLIQLSEQCFFALRREFGCRSPSTQLKQQRNIGLAFDPQLAQHGDGIRRSFGAIGANIDRHTSARS